jgi:hypothetical protein
MTRKFPSGEMRASDAERDLAIAELSEHFQSGRLTREDFEERSRLALLARTRTDLHDLFTDLPAPEGQMPGYDVPRGAPLRRTAAWETIRARDGSLRPIAAVVLRCAIVLIVLGNVAGGAIQGFHVSIALWMIPVAILAIILRQIDPRR